MSASVDLPKDVFIFNDKNWSFINGESRRLGCQGAYYKSYPDVLLSLSFAAWICVSTYFLSSF